ncbi:GDSL-type esterase/lipase family protein [Pedobacter sp. FW305-3-2-15-E-R2A2]|uniref:GDSL-type esterase/lipase family protein n=1 Tax=Pedobacter sp. FW305-3-2-15-E-R2A2 TaxID=3140251 RepID=UPI00314098AD
MISLNSSLKKIACYCLCLLCFHSKALAQNAKIKIACIGNSVTAGYGLKVPEKEAYPSVLQNLLGKGYDVQNFGFSGATLLKKGHRPYDQTKAFAKAIDFKADIAVVHLGLNDTDPRNWPQYRNDFEKDYAWLLDTLKHSNPEIKLYICRLTPIFSEHPRFKSGTREWYGQIQQLIPVISKANQTELIDLNTPLHRRPDLFADNLHPDKEGAAIIAQTVYQNLSGNFGGLKLPVVFADHMILQRNQPIPVFGMADAGERVEVVFHHQKQITAAGKDGKWKVWFPAMPAGGPYELHIKTEKRSIALNDILMGEVWLCSGQSNMVFPLRNAETGKAELSGLSENKNIRLMQFKSIAETNNSAWDSLTMENVNQLNYFSANWKLCNAANAADFSAIAYYFGKEIGKSENVPVGLIQLAVGGSTIESWIDRNTLEQDAQLVDVLANWRKSDFMMEWARGRVDVNLKNAAKIRQRHPYEPAYNYESGIAQLIEFPIKGLIWYQGESNVHNPELYAHSFPVLLNSWRKKWGYDFPVYYVQLSALDNPAWPEFRAMQQRLEKAIVHSGMAVSSDLGDSLDVHPKKKKEIGMRLALLALKNTYHKRVTAKGPVPIKARKQGEILLLSFAPGTTLRTKNNEPLSGFELNSAKGETLAVPGTIVGHKVQLRLPAGKEIKTVRYGWRPFNRANLTNKSGLPAATFTMPIAIN